MATDRIQLNLRLDGRAELLEAIKSAAAAKDLSINAFVLATMESAVGMVSSTAPTPSSEDLESVLDKLLDTKLEGRLDKLLADRLALRTEPVGELVA